MSTQQAPAGPKPTIVMVHGAWHWAGCFQKVATLLGQAGHPVILPDLKAHGYSDATCSSVDGMADYVAPLQAIVEAAAQPVVLLGHSMGGASLGYLAERFPSKVRLLVYLTAFMTPNGKSPNDYIFSAAYTGDPAAAEIFQLLSVSGDGKGIVLDTAKPDLVRKAFYDDCSDHDVAVAAANIIATTPIAPYAAPAVFTDANFGSVPRVYIECEADRAIPLAIQRQMQADVPGAAVMSLASSHSPFFSQPEALAALILKAIG